MATYRIWIATGEKPTTQKKMVHMMYTNLAQEDYQELLKQTSFLSYRYALGKDKKTTRVVEYSDLDSPVKGKIPNFPWETTPEELEAFKASLGEVTWHIMDEKSEMEQLKEENKNLREKIKELEAKLAQ